MIYHPCPACGMLLQSDDSHAGTTMVCQGCGGAIRVPFLPEATHSGGARRSRWKGKRLAAIAATLALVLAALLAYLSAGPWLRNEFEARITGLRNLVPNPAHTQTVPAATGLGPEPTATPAEDDHVIGRWNADENGQFAGAFTVYEADAKVFLREERRNGIRQVTPVSVSMFSTARRLDPSASEGAKHYWTVAPDGFLAVWEDGTLVREIAPERMNLARLDALMVSQVERDAASAPETEEVATTDETEYEYEDDFERAEVHRHAYAQIKQLLSEGKQPPAELYKLHADTASPSSRQPRRNYPRVARAPRGNPVTVRGPLGASPVARSPMGVPLGSHGSPGYSFRGGGAPPAAPLPPPVMAPVSPPVSPPVSSPGPGYGTTTTRTQRYITYYYYY